MVQFHVFSCFDVLRFPRKTMFGSFCICREFMFYLCYLHLFTYSCVQHDFPIIYYSCGVTVTQHVPLLEPELPALPEHRCSSPIFSGDRLVQSLVFCVVFCKSLIGSYIRFWERPGDLPRVIEILCLFASGAQRNERKERKISIMSGRSPGLCQQRI